MLTNLTAYVCIVAIGKSFHLRTPQLSCLENENGLRASQGLFQIGGLFVLCIIKISTVKNKST